MRGQLECPDESGRMGGVRNGGGTRGSPRACPRALEARSSPLVLGVQIRPKVGRPSPGRIEQSEERIDADRASEKAEDMTAPKTFTTASKRP